LIIQLPYNQDPIEKVKNIPGIKAESERKILNEYFRKTLNEMQKYLIVHEI